MDNANKLCRTIVEARQSQEPLDFQEVCLPTRRGRCLWLLYALADAAGFTVALISIRPARETLS